MSEVTAINKLEANAFESRFAISVFFSLALLRTCRLTVTALGKTSIISSFVAAPYLAPKFQIVFNRSNIPSPSTA